MLHACGCSKVWLLLSTACDSWFWLRLTHRAGSRRSRTPEGCSLKTTSSSLLGKSCWGTSGYDEWNLHLRNRTQATFEVNDTCRLQRRRYWTMSDKKDPGSLLGLSKPELKQMCCKSSIWCLFQGNKNLIVSVSLWLWEKKASLLLEAEKMTFWWVYLEILDHRPDCVTSWINLLQTFSFPL